MTDLSTRYLGLDLKNPLIVGSCGLTSSVKKIAELAEQGAGAIVLKSLFEEQIIAECKENLENYDTLYPDAVDYVREYTRNENVEAYLKLIREAKDAVDIPIIASINCTSANEWMSFASQIEKAGADAIELNISLLSTDSEVSGDAAEKIYGEIVDKLADIVSIPLSLKMSSFSAGLAHSITELSWKKNLGGFVLFNRYYRPDIDIEKMSFTSANVFSHSEEMQESLRWIALLSGQVEADFVASTGIHNSESIIKQILAGADAVQVVSTLYQKDAPSIATMLEEIEAWMEKKSFSSLADFKGKLGYGQDDKAAVFERTQFMKYYGGIA